VTRLLAIDTASTSFALALAEEGVVLRSLERPAGQDHSRLLLPAIRELLAGEEAIEAIAVVRGPGSYAGLRVGIATAQGLALARGLPMAGVGTLEAVAAASGVDPVTAIHPAGRGELAVQRFEAGRPVAEPHLALPDALGKGPLAGEGAGALGGLEVSTEARCRAAATIAFGLLARGPAEPFEALYLREPSISRPRRPAGAR
jgi:tRNA threonylcarbamoyladenosine biosynthesis protein TsaB